MTILIKDKLPLSGLDAESIQQTVGLVLKTADLIKFTVDSRTSMIDFWRLPGKEDAELLEVRYPFRQPLKEVEMEEYVPPENTTSHEQLFEMFDMIEDAGCFPVFILVGCPLPELRKWLPFPRKSKTLAGIPLLVEPELESDVLLVCGAKTREAEAIDITFAVKLTLP